MTGGRFPSVAALKVSDPSGHPSKDPPAFSPQHSLLGAWRRVSCGQPSPTAQHCSQPHSTTPHLSRVGVPTRLLDALWCRPSAARGQGATLSTFPQVPLTREPTCTQAIDPGTSGLTHTPADTSRRSHGSGHFPDFPWSGFPWLAHGSPLHADWFPIPTALLLGALCHLSLFLFLRNPAMSRSPLPHPVTGPFFASRVYTPPGRQKPSGAGPQEPHPSGDRSVLLALVTPVPSPCPALMERSLDQSRMILSGVSGHISHVEALLAYLCIGT